MLNFSRERRSVVAAAADPATMALEMYWHVANILFFKYPDYIADKIEGVSYKVVTVTSSFTGGKFEQDLSCVINTFPDANSDKKDNPRETEGEDNKLEGKNQTKNAGDQDFVGPRRDPETTDGNNDDGGG